MTKPNPFLWPKLSRLAFYNGYGRRLWETKDRKLDLSDSLMLHWPTPTRTVYLGIRTGSDKWKFWDESNLSKIEQLVRYDLRFDGYYVTIKRATPKNRRRCTSEFIWKLVIRS